MCYTMPTPRYISILSNHILKLSPIHLLESTNWRTMKLVVTLEYIF